MGVDLEQIHWCGEVSELERVVKRFGFEVCYTKLSPGPIDVESFEIRVNGALVYRERFGCHMVPHGSSAPEAFTVLVCRSGVGRFFGQEFSPREVVLYPPGCAFDALAFPDLVTTHFLLPVDRITAAAGEFEVDLIQSSRALVMAPGVDRLHHLQVIDDEVGEILDRQDVTGWRGLEQELVETFLGLFDVAAHGGSRLEPSSRSGVEHALAARRLICSTPPEELDLRSLARERGITRQHLNRCFRQTYAVAVNEFVHLWRLNQVRKVLLTNGRPVMTVTEAAYSCGFQHLGRFAGEYRELFGETPSETLRRTRA